MMDDDVDGGYRWEGNYEKSWELLQEGEDGTLISTGEDIGREQRRLVQERLSNVRLGVMRHLYIIIDLSKCMEENDLKPSRYMCIIKLVEAFIMEFYDQNPISQIGLIVVKNGRGHKISDLSSNINKHVAQLKAQKTASGPFSLINGLEFAIKGLSNMPSYASREVLIIAGALTSVDPCPIDDMLKTLVEQTIRVSVVGLSACVHLFSTVSSATKGTYTIMLDELHLQELLRAHCTPPPATHNMDCSLVKMGFPPHTTDGVISMCQCHSDDKGKAQLSTTGFTCPTCDSKYCDVPIECKTCSLTLVCAPHLARSYHHLFPLHHFTETEEYYVKECQGCNVTLEGVKHVYLCEKCGSCFCITCDMFIHDMLHHCPGCESRPPSSD